MNTTNYYLIKALRAYRTISIGQFDQETRVLVPETQDAAEVIEQLERDNIELKERVRVLETKKFLKERVQ